jgi:uncharacterized membrane protein YfcA
MEGYLYCTIALFIAGIVKGATGLGLPLVSLPVLLLFVTPPNAVIILALCTVVTNGWLVWHHRQEFTTDRPLLVAMLGMAVGCGIGTVLLVSADADVLKKLLGILMIAFVLLRLWRPGAWLRNGYSLKLGFSIGLAGGTMQGGLGAGAPVVAIFAQALNLAKERYVLTVSALYLAGALVQIPFLLVLAEIPRSALLLSMLAVVPVALGTVVGIRLSQMIDVKTFTKLVLVLIAVFGIAMIFS